MNNSDLLCIENLTIEDADAGAPLLSDISFVIKSGEKLGLSGPSGAGKSLLTKAIFGLLPQNLVVKSGQCKIDGRMYHLNEPQSLKALRGSFATLVLQESVASLHPLFTTGQQLTDVIMANHTIVRKAAKIVALDLLNAVGLTDPELVFSSYPHQLSGGMAQRVSISRALACNPKLLIADEPTSALDVFSQETLIDVLKNLHSKNGLSILLISHDNALLKSFCSRIIRIKKGKIFS